MKQANVAPTPLYKPLAYCEISKRSDLMLFTVLQKEVSYSENTVTFSPLVSNCFGISIEGSSAYLGIPNQIWPLFRHIDWQRFSVVGNQLFLHYKIRLRVMVARKTFVKKTETASTIDHKLVCAFPIRQDIADRLSASWMLQISPVSPDVDSINQTISLTSISAE